MPTAIPTKDDLFVLTKEPTTHHKYYVVAEVFAREDWNTKRVEITGLLGIAPNSTTIIEYPVHVWASGYWNKTTTRRVAAMVKQRLLGELKAVGYDKRELTEPMKVEIRM